MKQTKTKPKAVKKRVTPAGAGSVSKRAGRTGGTGDAVGGGVGDTLKGGHPTGPGLSRSGSGAVRREDRFVIIMAGGRGERFWPVSREKTPKQLITLLGGRSFLRQAVDRVLPVVPLRNIYVITNALQVPQVRRQLPRLPKEHIIAEPCGRDTCAAVTLGAALVGKRSARGVMAVLPADHVIPDEVKFQRVLADSLDLAGRGQVIVTIGIPPTEPATGYGYIRLGNVLPAPRGVKRYRTVFRKVEQFVEKPDRETAEGYLRSGDYRWNAGMFIWSFVTITQGLETHQPEMAAACRRWFEVAGTPKLARVLAREYPAITRISIDFALMEKARNVVAAEGTFAWDDLGSWTALARHIRPDVGGNCAVGDFVQVDAERNVIYDARTRNRTPIAVVGLRDSIIVQTDDATLVASKEKAQKLKELVARLAGDRRYRKLV